MTSSASLSIKVCGLRDPENIRAIADLSPDMMGFIFYPPSKRFVGDVLQPEVVRSLPASIAKVGVFVNATNEEMLQTVARFHLDVLQLHGDETPEQIASLRKLEPKLSIWKAMGIQEPSDLNQAANYQGLCERLLFDTKTSDYGGSGRTFDWSLLQSYAGASLSVASTTDKAKKAPFFLSGGLGLNNISEAKAFVLATPLCVGVDINSRVEVSPGLKSVEQVKQVIQTLRGETT
ncbi:MAG: phosphoribosylanthranilate isomerase [Deltaproteobacteria bacterium]|nr:MAG: phosphoribosylanthranilate isomerase [Deltaproteobacteria bacterium]